MTTAKAVKTTQNGKEVRYIIADLDCVKVEEIPNSVGNSGKFGINGTFFKGNGDLLGVALNRTGTTAAPVKTGGDKTGYANSDAGPLTDTKRGVLYHFNPAHPITSVEIDNKVVYRWTDFIGATSSNVKWAIGGISLHLDQPYTTINNYFDAIKESPEYGKNLGHNLPNGRSAIGFALIGGQRKIILASFKDANYWDVRQFLKGLGCTKGVHLDGSGSSQLRYKRVINPVGSFVTETWEPKPDQPSGNRPVYNMVTVNPTTWEIASGF